MTESEGESVDVQLTDLLRMVEKLTENQEIHTKELEEQIASLGEQVDKRFDKFQHIVVGNGDERAVIVRLWDVEKKTDGRGEQYDRILERLDSLESFQETWRNRIIGIMIAFPVITALLVNVVAYVLGIAAAP